MFWKNVKKSAALSSFRFDRFVEVAGGDSGRVGYCNGWPAMILTPEGLDALATPLWTTYGLFSEWGVAQLPLPLDSRLAKFLRVTTDLQRVNKIIESRTNNVQVPGYRISNNGALTLESGYQSSVRANVAGAVIGIVLEWSDAETVWQGIHYIRTEMSTYLRYNEIPVLRERTILQKPFMETLLHLSNSPEKIEARDKSKANLDS